MRKKIIVVGSGIAGLSVAVALQKMDMDVSVYERASKPTVAGAGIIIAPNALKALEPFGIAQTIKERGKPSDGFHILSEQGKMLNKLTIPSSYQYMYSIHRKDLHNILLSALRPNTVNWGKNFSHVIQDSQGVQVTFEDNSIVTGDILIAADGIHSPIRKQLFPNSSYRYAGYTCWRGVMATKGIPNIKESFFETWGSQGRFGIVPLPNDQVYWYALVNAKPNDANYIKFTTTDLFNHFKEYHFPIPTLLNNTDEHQMIHRDVFDIVPMDKFYHYRTVFIGDAAHAVTPNMGQGACQAIEDARILAEYLNKYENITQAFANYNAHRKEKVNTISKQSWNIGKMAQMNNRFLISLRNKLLTLTPQVMIQKQAQHVYNFETTK